MFSWLPLHDCPLLIARRLSTATTTYQDNSPKLDLDALYTAASNLSLTQSLNLDYGLISGRDRCWESRVGEEVSGPPTMTTIK